MVTVNSNHLSDKSVTEHPCCPMLAIWVIHTSAKSGCKLVTLLSDRWLLLCYVTRLVRRHSSGIFCVYLGHISCIYQPYLRHISAISQPYIRHISGISQAHLGKISGKCQIYLRSGWAEIASRLKYQPVIAGYFHLKKHNFGWLLMVKIIKWTHFRRDRIDPQ